MDSRTPPNAHREDRFAPDLLYRAARLYYLEEATQAEVARALGTSRPTVSRLLAEARARGIVHIEVREPHQDDLTGLAVDLARHLGLRRAWVTADAAGRPLGPILAPAVSEAILEAELSGGDALLVSSGMSVHQVSQQTLPPLPGVQMAPTVGGMDEPEAHYQTNEITRQLAVKCGGVPRFLYAPAIPGPALYDGLLADESVASVMELWRRARCALLGIGAPPATRTSLPTVIPRDADFLARSIGDICSRPFDQTGAPIPFPGCDRLIAMELDELRRIPFGIGIAVGPTKVPTIAVAARAGFINHLVTDRETATALLADEHVPTDGHTPGTQDTPVAS